MPQSRKMQGSGAFTQSLHISNHLLIPQSLSLWQNQSHCALETGIKIHAVLLGLFAALVFLAPVNFCLFVAAFPKRAQGPSLRPFIFQMHVHWVESRCFSCCPPAWYSFLLCLLTLTVPRTSL